MMALAATTLLLPSCGKSAPPTAPSPPPSPQAAWQTIYTSANLSGHEVAAECNPGGGTSCPCGASDAQLLSLADHGEVISNPFGRRTYVNAIGHRKFIETLPTGGAVSLSRYRYSGQFQLADQPRPDASQVANPQSLHAMVQLWDGRNKLFAANRETREGAIYYDLNPWSADYGKIKVYRQSTQLQDVGLVVPPDTAWHSFELVVDLKTMEYVSVAIDGRTVGLGGVPLARVAQPTWGTEVALMITTESEAAWPQQNCSLVFTWTTRFRELKLEMM